MVLITPIDIRLGAEIVNMTTGMFFRAGLSSSSAKMSRPSFFGRVRSSKIRSGRGALVLPFAPERPLLLPHPVLHESR